MQMMGKQLFWQRLREEWKFQISVIRSVFDLTVIVYFVVPALIIFPFVYHDVWNNVHLYWHAEIPMNLLIFILLLALLRGNFRTFIHEPDLLFIVQRRSLIQSLKRWSLHYSIGQFVVGTSAFIVLFLPILHSAYEYGFSDIVRLLSFLLTYRLVQLTIKKLIIHNFFRILIMTTVFFLSLYIWQALTSLLFIVGYVIIMIGIYYLHYIKFIKTNKYFLQELDIERTERVRYIQLIFSFAQEVEKTPRRYLRKPLFFFPSKRIFYRLNDRQKMGLLEVLLKRFLRDRVLVMGYINLVSLSLVAIYFMPVWIKWIIFSFFLFALSAWLRSIFDKLLDHSFFTIIIYDENIYFSTWKSFRKWLAFPMFLLVGCLTIILSFF